MALASQQSSTFTNGNPVTRSNWLRRWSCGGVVLLEQSGASLPKIRKGKAVIGRIGRSSVNESSKISNPLSRQSGTENWEPRNPRSRGANVRSRINFVGSCPDGWIYLCIVTCTCEVELGTDLTWAKLTAIKLTRFHHGQSMITIRKLRIMDLVGVYQPQVSPVFPRITVHVLHDFTISRSRFVAPGRICKAPLTGSPGTPFHPNVLFLFQSL